MNPAANRTWSAEQRQRLEKYDTRRSVDIHCHCLPGLDDGPASIDEAISLCEALVHDGITSVIATPHQLGRYDRRNSAEQIRQAINQLTEELRRNGIPLEIFAGGDVRVDERLPRLLELGEVGTVADAGAHLLLELPHEIFVNPLPVIDLLRKRGVQAIMTHPERHHYLPSAGRWAYDWIEHGAVLQITAGSLLREFGNRAYESAWRLVSSGMASLVASDAHDVRRRAPRMSDAINVLTGQLGSETARLLTIDNPLRVLNGQALEAPQVA
jgi:protein-tyrosine phosphatase